MSESLRSLGRSHLAGIMDALFDRAMAPEHESCATTLTPLARQILYVRGHWLRMPLRLLVPHLAHKAFVSTERQPAG